MDLVFICFDILAIIVSFGYVRCGLRRSALMTLILGALTLIRVPVIQWIGVVCVSFVTLCFLIFRTAIGRYILLRLGRDATGRKANKDQ